METPRRNEEMRFSPFDRAYETRNEFNFDVLTPPFDSTPSKRTPFSAISLIVCVCMHQTGPSHGSKTRRNEGMWFSPPLELMKVSHWSNFGALTPPFDFTPPRKPHVHPYPPDGFIPQARALRLCEGVVELVGRWAGNR